MVCMAIARSLWVSGVLLAAAGLFAPLGAAAQEPFDAVDTGVARAYYRGARALVEQDLPGEAARLLDVALQFSRRDSDILYLQAELFSREQRSTRAALEAARDAISANNWTDFDERTGRLLLADLLFRTREYQSVVDVLSAIEETPIPEPVLLRLARAFAALGDLREARDLAERGEALYPDATGFSVVLLRLDDEPGFQWGRWLRQNASSDPAVLSAMLYYAERQPVAREAREIIDLYRSLGGSDPLAILIDMESGGRSDLDTFRRLGGFEDLGLVRRLYPLSAVVGVREEVDEFVVTADGWLVSDADRDGFFESRSLFDAGTLRRREWDLNQNGLAERTVLFDGLSPLEVVEREPPPISPAGQTVESLRMSYDPYPWVDSVSARDESGIRDYRLIPQRVSYEVLESGLDRGTEVPDMLIPLEYVSALVPLGTVRRYAVRLEVRHDDGATPRRIESYDSGVIYLSEHDGNADGDIDYIAEYAGGEIVSATRDLDADGFFEVVEQYVDGRLALIVVDRNGDGIPEFQTRYGRVTTLAWDFDEDGEIDATELRSGRDRLLDAGRASHIEDDE